MARGSMAYLVTTLSRKGVGHRAPAAQLHPEDCSGEGFQTTTHSLAGLSITSLPLI